MAPLSRPRSTAPSTARPRAWASCPPPRTSPRATPTARSTPSSRRSPATAGRAPSRCRAASSPARPQPPWLSRATASRSPSSPAAGYVTKHGGRAKAVGGPANPADPSYSTGLRNDLVFGASGGVYLAKDSRRPRNVGRGGRNPVYNDIKRQVVAYEKNFGGHTQIAYHDIGKSERVISSGHGDASNPVIGNSGYYVSFQGTASHGTYLYTDTRKIVLPTSLTPQGRMLPAGGENPSMSFYSNYVAFDTPSNLDAGTGQRQVFMRYVGGK